VSPGQRIAAEPATITSIAAVVSAAEIPLRALACTPGAYAGGASGCYDAACVTTLLAVGVGEVSVSIDGLKACHDALRGRPETIA